MSPKSNKSLTRVLQKPFLAGVVRGLGYKSAGTGFSPGAGQSTAEVRAQDALVIRSYWKATGQHMQHAMENVDAELRTKQP